MTRIRQTALATLCALLAPGFAAADGGYATRDMNPMLQPIYLPTLATFGAVDGWKIDHSVYISNTLQDQSRGDEELLIDVENYRYELGLRFRQERWRARIDIPYIANSAGELDGTIDNWHDFWGFSDGSRNDFPNDQINISYQRDGEIEYRQDERSSGLADIGLALGYQVTDGLAWFAGIEIPTGDADDFSGNEAVDTALWLTYQGHLSEDSGVFALFGLSFPGDGGDLEGLVVERIWVAQAGFDYRLYPSVIATLQLDWHSETIEDSELRAFGNSLQVQIGLGITDFPGKHRLDLFFSEDIVVGSAPDITFGLRLSRAYD